jgi:hypothetical protein
MANTVKKFEGKSMISAEYGEFLLTSDEGIHYWSIDDDAPEDAWSEQETPVAVTDAAELALVKAICGPCVFIDRQIQENIRAKYTMEDELGILRGANTAGKAAIKEIVDAGIAKKTALGF